MKPKRQRIRPSSRDQKPKKQTFYFVDSNNTSSSEKRAHVMRHHIEKKRKQQQDWITSVNGDRDGDKDHWWRKDSGFEANSTTRAPGGNESQSASTTVCNGTSPDSCVVRHNPILPMDINLLPRSMDTMT